MLKNPYARSAYRPIGKEALHNQEYYTEPVDPVVFTGGDIFAYFNNNPVGNLEAINWTKSSEVAGSFVFGQNDALVYASGKRVIVGSMMLAQFDKHALLEEVFNITKNKTTFARDFWNPTIPAYNLRNTSRNPLYASDGKGAGGRTDVVMAGSTSGSPWGQTGDYGLSGVEFQQLQQEQARRAADIAGARKIDYVDQLPPFDVTLVGVTRSGQAARCTIFGVQVNQESGGWAMQDVGNSVGFNFYARHASPWRKVEDPLAAAVQTITRLA